MFRCRKHGNLREQLATSEEKHRKDCSVGSLNTEKSKRVALHFSCLFLQAQAKGRHGEELSSSNTIALDDSQAHGIKYFQK